MGVVFLNIDQYQLVTTKSAADDYRTGSVTIFQ